ncbi:1,8-cineole synthase [Gossypium australe]|uniref:1,8-cineole synthase n=1 Tax=Gossypium australe TaxID=47621 RepID=A0A5B6WNI6_9ROSI|nr:1,8-cineole synthase [Gossypium australe]
MEVEMDMMENLPSTISPLLLRSMASSVFIYADKLFINLAEKFKPFEIIRYVLITSFLFFLRLLSFLFLSDLPPKSQSHVYTFNPPKSNDRYLIGSGVSDSEIARALSQVLSIVNDIPVSSRKYAIVRSLAEGLIEENRREDSEGLREVNRAVLSSAFSRTLSYLEAAMVELGQDRIGHDGAGPAPVQYWVKRALRVVRSVGDGVWAREGSGGVREDVNRSGNSAEKLAAELLWLAQKLVDCGFGEEAVERWASASNLASLSLLAEPRLQGSLVKVSSMFPLSSSFVKSLTFSQFAFLFKQARDMEMALDETEEFYEESRRQTKMKMLTSWLPLLCRASNGSDMPVLSINEKAELEKVLEETIELLDHKEQEQVLSLWLHHFAYCSSSDWPNLHALYCRWCTNSRKLLILH